MMTNCVRKSKTGIDCADVVEMWEGLWRSEEKFSKNKTMNKKQCKIILFTNVIAQFLNQ